MEKAKKIKIDGQYIGSEEPPYIIAEISANHNGDIDTALRLIREAKKAGANAVKIQTYRPDTITLKSEAADFQITEGLWAGRSLYDLYEWAHTPWEWHGRLFECARDVGISLFSSPFDETAVDLLEDLNAPAYKIASFEAIDLPLVRYVAETGKPIIVSTGMATVEEIEEAIDAAHSGKSTEVAVLHCVSGYPAPASDYNVRTIPDMIDRFGLVTGLSDHTLENATAVAAVCLGASLIEKHFTLDRSGGGPDDSFSLEPDDLVALTRDARIAWESLGTVDYGRKASEEFNTKFRRSLYIAEDVRAGDLLTRVNLRSVRPGYGLAPKHRDVLLGQKANRDLPAGTAMSWEFVDIRGASSS